MTLRVFELKLGGLYTPVGCLFVRTSAVTEVEFSRSMLIDEGTPFILVDIHEKPDLGKVRTYYVLLSPFCKGWFDCLGNDNNTWIQKFKHYGDH